MRRRHIAIEQASKQWRYAVASGEQQEARLVAAGTFQRDNDKSLADQLSEKIGPLQMTDRLAYTLPARCAMVRWLEFPFSDTRKIAATVRPEMVRQLPRPTAELAFFHQHLDSNRVLSVAIEKQLLVELIGQFDDNREPLGYLGLAPFCYATGIEWSEDGLLIYVGQDEVSLGRCENGRLTDLRVLPGTTHEEHADILQQALLLARSTPEAQLNIKLLGVPADSTLRKKLQQAGFRISPIQLKSEQGPPAEELQSTACLALAACKAADKTLNLRSGSYRLKNDWQALKRRMWLAGGIVIVTLLLLIGNGSLQYQRRASELKQLEQQMNTLYQQEFPAEKLTVPAPLLLQSKIKELRNKTRQFDSAAPSALQLLLALSQSIAPEISVDIKEYLYSEDGLKLTGSTENFDAVSKLLAGLQKNKHFQEVRILDSKQALDGSKVDFQLQIQLGGDR